jgi:uncharacterized membrane protein YuzA (DUF378 family)
VVRKGAWVLVLVGALNWGLVGAFGFDLVAAIFGGGSILARIVYVLVGVSAVMLILGCTRCKKGAGACKDGSCKVESKDMCKDECSGDECKTCTVK